MSDAIGAARANLITVLKHAG